MYSKYSKPVFDFILSLLGLVLLSPILLIITALLLFSNNGSPFYVQNRPGKKGKVFKLIKFKTMNEKRDDNGNLLPDKDRLTIIGKFIRKVSLDELLQLINVLKGDMSLIGPRPLLVEYLQYYSSEQARRHEVKPGITGWAQINGRNSISWEEKFELDIWYVDNISLKLDIKILLRTFSNVIRLKNINQSPDVTMEFFRPKN
jgi:lipopolysaccharide/colanic/teichoic acid biosynthesis glycosyltransferase